MNIIHRGKSIVSLPIIAVLVGLSYVGAVNAGTPSDACVLLTAPQVSSALGS
jgi:hypothetical protein